MKTETERNAPLTIAEKVLAVLALLSPFVALFLVAFLLGGCAANKASHQNGIVVYVSTSGQLGVGFGETESLPAGCVFYRLKDIYTVTEANWLFGETTNHTVTVTYWDTTGMVTNDCKCLSETN